MSDLAFRTLTLKSLQGSLAVDGGAYSTQSPFRSFPSIDNQRRQHPWYPTNTRQYQHQQNRTTALINYSQGWKNNAQ
jgi:hypothetical protein